MTTAEPTQPARDPLLWRCPDCGTSSWPGVDRDGRVIARRCVPCQCIADDAAAQVAHVLAVAAGLEPVQPQTPEGYGGA